MLKDPLTTFTYGLHAVLGAPSVSSERITQPEVPDIFCVENLSAPDNTLFPKVLAVVELRQVSSSLASRLPEESPRFRRQLQVLPPYSELSTIYLEAEAKSDRCVLASVNQECWGVF